MDSGQATQATGLDFLTLPLPDTKDLRFLLGSGYMAAGWRVPPPQIFNWFYKLILSCQHWFRLGTLWIAELTRIREKVLELHARISSRHLIVIIISQWSNSWSTHSTQTGLRFINGGTEKPFWVVLHSWICILFPPQFAGSKKLYFLPSFFCYFLKTGGRG